MLSITTKSPYAVGALAELYLMADTAPVPIPELARRSGTPPQFLEQLFATLRRGGILRSQRGVRGGYSFTRPADQVTVLEVVELLEGPLGQDADGVFGKAAQAAADVLAAHTIADVAQELAREAGTSMYFI